MTKVDIPRIINRKNKSGEYIDDEYIIYKEDRDDDACGDIHLGDLINQWSYDNIRNRTIKKYYKACYDQKELIEYDWFMDEIEKYFNRFNDIEVERDTEKCWGKEYEYIILKFNRN